MPHLALQVAPGGPLIDVLIGVSKARQLALTQAGQSVPSSLQVRALIDTGASCSCIDPSIPKALGLAPTGIVTMLTPSTGGQPHTANQYDVSLVLRHPNLSLTLWTVAMAESQLLMQGIQALIGRDVLTNCLLVYDGQVGSFTLAF